MSKPQKTLVVAMWVAAVAVMMCILALKELPTGQSATLEDIPVLYPAPAFTLTTQDGTQFTSDQLRGHPWIADFIFTTCTSLCPVMSTHMATLQYALPNEVKLVSFSVDPQHDTPPVLRDYATRYNAQPGRWIFLTGDLKTQTQVITAMKLYFKPADGTSPIQHDQHLVLVDGENRVRDFYDSYSSSDMDRLVRDAKNLAAQPDGGGQQ
jgi:protein SCO1/2